MKPHWFVAKYMYDLRRREPRNIGVVLFQGGRAYMRFLGEDETKPEGVDGRSVKNIVGSTGVYKEWVKFWRREAPRRKEGELLRRRADDNFFLERGGEVWAGDTPDPRAFVDELFAILVAPVSYEQPAEAEAEKESVDDIGELFEELSAEFEVIPNYSVDLDPDRLLFQYAIPHFGRLALFRTVKLNGNAAGTWQQVHEAVYSIEAAKADAGNRKPFALVTQSDPGEQVPRQRRVLEAKLGGSIIDASDRGAAKHTIRSALKIA